MLNQMDQRMDYKFFVFSANLAGTSSEKRV